MNHLLKKLMICLILAITLGFIHSSSTAQIMGVPDSGSHGPIKVMTWADTFLGKRDIIIDNFEYLNNPEKHGWSRDPPFIYYAYSIVTFTVLDLQHSSRVLDVYRHDGRVKYFRDLFTPPSSDADPSPNHIELDKYPNIFFDFRAPRDTDPEFEFIVKGLTETGSDVTIRIIPDDSSKRDMPLQGKWPFLWTGLIKDDIEPSHSYSASVTGFSQQALEVTVYIGVDLLDNSWHEVRVDLYNAVKGAVDDFEAISVKEDWYMTRADFISFSGRMFRLDNIIFKAKYDDDISLGNLDLFEMGPLYAHILEPYRYLFIADYSDANIKGFVNGEAFEYNNIFDLMLNPGNFLITQDPNDPNDPVVRYWIDQGADPNRFGEVDPGISLLFDSNGNRGFMVDLSLPVFADPNLRFGGMAAKRIVDQGALDWNITTVGYSPKSALSILLQPLPVNPYDGIPTYLPAKNTALDAIAHLGKPYFRPEHVFLLEGALWNAGVTIWPNIAALDLTPQHYEDLIVIIEVNNGMHSDTVTFPISVVNYPIENYPPVLQLDVEDQTFYIGEVREYHVNFIDPDCFIFSMSPDPKTSHIPGFPVSDYFRKDMDDLQWAMTITGLPSYQYGPWLDTIINPFTGLIRLAPGFKGAYGAIITCEDARGGNAFGEISLFFTYPSDTASGPSSGNHSPVIVSGPEGAVVVRAGKEVLLTAPDIVVYDPDGDRLFAASNIGSVYQSGDNGFKWSFHGYFPGLYRVQIVFYDTGGGYNTMQFFVDVKPWWSY